MSSSFSVGGGNATWTLTRIAPTAKAAAFINAFCEAMYARQYKHYPRNGGGALIAVGSLTNQQKVDLLEAYAMDKIKDATRGNYLEAAGNAAKVTAESTYNADLAL